MDVWLFSWEPYEIWTCHHRRYEVSNDDVNSLDWHEGHFSYWKYVKDQHLQKIKQLLVLLCKYTVK